MFGLSQASMEAGPVLTKLALGAIDFGTSGLTRRPTLISEYPNMPLFEHKWPLRALNELKRQL